MDSDPNAEQNTNVNSQAAPAPAPTPVTPAPVVQTTAPEAKKKNTGLIIAIVVGSLLVIGVIAYIVEKILFPSVVVGDWACTPHRKPLHRIHLTSGWDRRRSCASSFRWWR